MGNKICKICDLLVHRMMLNQLSHTSQGQGLCLNHHYIADLKHSDLH